VGARIGKHFECKDAPHEAARLEQRAEKGPIFGKSAANTICSSEFDFEIEFAAAVSRS
jgi:hypothetical protein